MAIASAALADGRQPVPELDRVSIDVAAIGSRSDAPAVRAMLGEPSFSAKDRLGVTFWYPIRIPAAAPVARVTPAAALRVVLDSSGHVTDWAFFDPASGARLEIRESLAQADHWYRTLCNPPARIELASALAKGTSRARILEAMRWFKVWETNAPFLEQTLVRSATHEGRETLTFYADRPSPLFVPPFYYEVTFYAHGSTGKTIQGWGGCK